MLKTIKSITLNSTSEINGIVVVNLSATVPDNTGVGSINQYIQNTELYEANRVQVRKDVSEFQDLVYEIEDSMLAESVK